MTNSKKNINEIGDEFWHDDNGNFHKKDAPAIIYANGDKKWYQNGKLHRLDGPAVDLIDGTKFWYYQGQDIDCVSQQEFEKLIKLKVFW